MLLDIWDWMVSNTILLSGEWVAKTKSFRYAVIGPDWPCVLVTYVFIIVPSVCAYVYLVQNLIEEVIYIQIIRYRGIMQWPCRCYSSILLLSISPAVVSYHGISWRIDCSPCPQGLWWPASLPPIDDVEISDRSPFIHTYLMSLWYRGLLTPRWL